MRQGVRRDRTSFRLTRVHSIRPNTVHGIFSCYVQTLQVSRRERGTRNATTRNREVLVPSASPVPSVVRGSFVVKSCT